MRLFLFLVLLIILHVKSVLSLRLKSLFERTHPFHSPSIIYQSPCTITEDEYRSCSLKRPINNNNNNHTPSSSSSSSWNGIKKVSKTGRFVLLKPLPQGSFNFARRVCEICDLEVAEIWDEGDLREFLEIVGENKGNSSYWTGAFLNDKEPTTRYRWTYQDGKTFVPFKETVQEVGESTNASSRKCLTLKKSSDKSSSAEWISRPCDTPKLNVVCQYKRKYECYEDGRKPNLEKIQDGYFLSSKAVSWPVASHTCQTFSHTQTLFQIQVPQKNKPSTTNEGSNLISSKLLRDFLTSHSHNPLTLELWTGWKFDDDKSRVIWEDGESIKEVARDLLPWGDNEPKEEDDSDEDDDEGTSYSSKSSSSCIYAKLDGGSFKLYTDSCQKEKFFICQNLLQSQEGYPKIRYCGGEGDLELVEKKGSECQWNWLFDKKPGCICYEGVHGLTSHLTCNTRLLLGPHCIKLLPPSSSSPKKSLLHWKPIPDLKDPQGPFLLLQQRNRRGNKFIQWIVLKPPSMRQIFGDANIYFRGLSLRTDKKKRKYCFHLDPNFHQNNNRSTNNASNSTKREEGYYQELRLRDESFWIIFNHNETKSEDECGKGTTLKVKVKRHSIPNTKGECDLPCSTKKSPEKNGVTSSTQFPSNGTTNSTASLPLNKESNSHTLNTEILKATIDLMFLGENEKKRPHHKDTNPPPLRLNLLEKMFNLTSNVCSCMVPSPFLQNVATIFHQAFISTNYKFVKDFSHSEAEKVGQMMDQCVENGQDKAIVCQRNECSGRVLQTADMTEGGQGGSSLNKLKITSMDDTSYEVSGHHHHLIEVVWHVIEIWNVGCMEEFRGSYLLYHQVEEVMERLFINEIRDLWHDPSTPPNFYKHLLGPNEEVNLANLKNCVETLYESNPKISKLLRPKTTPTKELGKQIRSRKRNEEFLKDEEDNPLKKEVGFCSKEQFCLD